VKFTGERLVPGIPSLENMIAEELARLNFIKEQFVGKLVLDAGCGVGYSSAFIAESGARRVVGVDISSEAIQYAREHYKLNNLEFEVMDCTSLGFLNESFDFVCSLDVIEHLDDTAKYLSEIHRVLKTGGIYYLSTPNRNATSLKGKKPSWAFHVKEFSLHELREVLGTHFSQVDIWGDFVPIYEEHPIRKLTKSPLSKIKHFIPARIRVGFSSTVRCLIKGNLRVEDVVFTRDSLEDRWIFLAVCAK